MQKFDLVEPTPKQMRQAIFALALPTVGTNLLLRGVGIVDTAMVGHISAQAQAAVGMAQWIINLMMAIMQGVALGGTILVANYTGARDDKGRLNSADSAMYLGVGVSFAITILGLLTVKPIAFSMGATSELYELVEPYMLVMNLFFISKGMLQVISGVFQGFGDTKTPFRVIIGVNILHVIIAYPLTFGVWGFPRMEIMGVAIATGVSESMGAALLIYLAYRKKLISFGKYSSRLLKDIVALGGPVFGERISTTIMQMVYTRMVLVTSLSAYAAHSVGITIESISFLPGFGFAQAATTLVGQQLGARQPDRARKYGDQALYIGLVIMGVLGATFFFFPELWMRMFSNDPEVIKYGITFCRIVAFIQLPMGAAMVLSGSLRGAGKTRSVMYSTVIGGWLFRIPYSLIVSSMLHLDVFYIWLAMPIDWVARSSMLFINYTKSKWHEK